MKNKENMYESSGYELGLGIDARLQRRFRGLPKARLPFLTSLRSITLFTR